MSNKYYDVDFYVDCLIVEATLSNKIVKNADGSFISSLINGVKDYFSSKIDSNNLVSSFLGMIAPMAVYKILDYMGFKWFKWLAAFVTSMYSVDITKIISGISDPISKLVKGGDKVSPQQVSSAVDSAVESTNFTVKDSASQPSQAPAATPAPAPAPKRKPAPAPAADEGGDDDEDDVPSVGESAVAAAPAAAPASAKKPATTTSERASFPKLSSLNMKIRQAQLCKIEVLSFKDNYENSFIKNANAAATLTASQAKGLIPKFKEVIKSVFKWFFITALGTVGLLVAGDALNALFGRPSSLSGNLSASAPAAASAPKIPPATQKKFPINPSYKEEDYKPGDLWSEETSVNQVSVESVVLDYAKDVYTKLDGLESLIKSTNGFNAAVSTILRNNFRRIGTSVLIIPTNVFSSKKQIVDTFIDDVAAKSK